MAVAGLDVGAIYTKGVVLSNGTVLSKVKLLQGSESVPATAAKVLSQVAAAAGLRPEALERIGVTGVGKEECDPAWRKLVDGMCLAKAADRLYPDTKVVLDVGAQKVLAVRCVGGKPFKFSKNEQCAGGTGRFLEMAASILMISLPEMDQAAAKSANPVELQSICSVFAESEILSQIHVTKAGAPDIAAGVYRALANRLFPLIARVGLQQEVLLAGGVSQSRTLRQYLNDLLGFSTKLPEEFEFLGALGAGIIAAEGFAG